jgi:hypothetical protein
MAPRLEELRPPADRHVGRAATTGARPRRRGHITSARDGQDRRHPTEPAVPECPRPPLADRGLILFVIFTASTLAIVGLVVVIGAIGSWWTLIPVVVIDFTVTAAVLITVAKLLEDSDT